MKRTDGDSAFSGLVRRLAVVALVAGTTSAGAQPGGQAQPPALGPTPKLTLPPVFNKTLRNGFRVIVVERHEIPLVDAIFITGRGVESDPETKPGLATLTAQMLMQGTTTRSSTDIAADAALLGATIDAAATWDYSTIALHVPTATLDSGMALLADVANNPAFQDTEFDRLKHERLADLIELSDRPPAVAERAFSAIVYGSDSPYGRPALGTEHSVNAITIGDVRAVYNLGFERNTETLILVGDITADDAVRRAEALFGEKTDMSGGFPTPPAAPPPIARTTIYVIDKHDAPQSSIRIGGVGVARSTLDYFPLEVMNTILGGAFTSRLNENLRETHAYTYGAFSGFAMRRGAGPFSAEAEVVAAKTDSSLIQFMRELRGIRDTIPLSELRKAKHYLQLQLPGELETSHDVAEHLVALTVYHVPLDFYNSYQAHVGAVTQADVHRVAQRYIDPAHLAIVVVGDRQSIEQPLAHTKIGPVEDRGLDGLPTSK